MKQADVEAFQFLNYSSIHYINRNRNTGKTFTGIVEWFCTFFLFFFFLFLTIFSFSVFADLVLTVIQLNVNKREKEVFWPFLQVQLPVGQTK